MKEQQMKTMPIVALRGMALLPGMLVHLDVSRDITKQAIEEAMAEDGMVFITAQKEDSVEEPEFHDLYEVGVIAQVRQEVKMNDDVVRVMLSVKERGNLFPNGLTKQLFRLFQVHLKKRVKI